MEGVAYQIFGQIHISTEILHSISDGDICRHGHLPDYWPEVQASPDTERQRQSSGGRDGPPFGLGQRGGLLRGRPRSASGRFFQQSRGADGPDRGHHAPTTHSQRNRPGSVLRGRWRCGGERRSPKIPLRHRAQRVLLRSHQLLRHPAGGGRDGGAGRGTGWALP